MVINKENSGTAPSKEGTRNTTQRIKILEYLKSVQTHPTAEQVYNEVKKDLPAITLATVYRNLNLLAEKREILRLEINKEYHYDADMSLHQHCVCLRCNIIKDSFQKEPFKNILDKIKFDDFKVSFFNVIFFGVCDDCTKSLNQG